MNEGKVKREVSIRIGEKSGAVFKMVQTDYLVGVGLKTLAVVRATVA